MPTLINSARFSFAEALLSFFGAGIAGTLWWAHRRHVDLPCTADGGCSQIAGSSQAYVTLGPWHDVSVALLGFLAYLALLTFSMLKLGSDSPGATRFWWRLLWVTSAFGFAYSWYLQYIARFQIGAFCVWCFSSALVMSALFAIATLETIRDRRRRSDNASGAAQELPNTHG